MGHFRIVAEGREGVGGSYIVQAAVDVNRSANSEARSADLCH